MYRCLLYGDIPADTEPHRGIVVICDLAQKLEKSDSCLSIYYMSNNVDICKDTIDQYQYKTDMIVARVIIVK